MNPEKRDQRLFLLDIIGAIADIREFTEGGAREFFRSKLVQDAVIRKVEVIGEAVRRLRPETKAGAAEIPWRRISGTRDILSHGYYHVDLNIVWEIVELELEPLEAAVKNLMEAMNS